jgi:hypothetical protein
MKTVVPRSAFAAAALAAAVAAAFFCAATLGRAATWGHAKWCAVTNDGGTLMWECVFDTADECQPFILAGNRGYCSLNPYWGKEPADFDR